MCQRRAGGNYFNIAYHFLIFTFANLYPNQWNCTCCLDSYKCLFLLETYQTIFLPLWSVGVCENLAVLSKNWSIFSDFQGRRLKCIISFKPTSEFAVIQINVTFSCTRVEPQFLPSWSQTCCLWQVQITSSPWTYMLLRFRYELKLGKMTLFRCRQADDTSASQILPVEWCRPVGQWQAVFMSYDTWSLVNKIAAVLD